MVLHRRKGAPSLGFLQNSPMQTLPRSSDPCALRRLLGLALLSSALSGAAWAGDIDGAWRLDQPRPWGVTLHTYLVLHQSGPLIRGTVAPNGSGGIPISDARVEGSALAFSLKDWGWYFHVRQEGVNLRVQVSYSGGDSSEGLAVPVSEDELKDPVPVPPPALKTLPDNGLARTPPMGWNSWNHFAEKVDDAIVRRAADAMVTSGMAAAGYVYINIDDTWEAGRDAQGNILTNKKFPDMKALADYVHSKGLKLGLYSSPGPVTCGGYTGSYGHEEQDAKTYAAWGIDYLKYDWCSAGRLYRDADLRAIYQRMGEALLNSGRPIVFSLCEYGMGDVWTWAPAVSGNLWRTTGDISDHWESMANIGFNQGRLAPYAGPGHWNDPDMLEVGNGGMSATEYRTHFSLWCLLDAPLMAGNDLSTMSLETRDILANREVIALDQDALGLEATRILEKGGIEVWAKPLQGGGLAVGLFNRGPEARPAAFTWAELGSPAKPASVRDLWNHADLGVDAEGFKGSVPSHGVVLLRLK